MRDFRLIITALAAPALLAGCGESSEPQAAAPQSIETPTGESGSAAIDQARRDAEAATRAAGDLDPLAGLGDSTATEALESYIAACTAGDFARAAEFCHPDSPGTAKLINLDAKFTEASSDPDVAGMNLGAFLTQGFDQITHSVVEQGEDRWAFEVGMPGKQPVRIEVAKLDEGWRVLPPEQTGLPTG